MIRKNDRDPSETIAFVRGDTRVPLFPELGEDADEPSHIAVSRVPEGYLMEAELNINEEWLKNNLGGGVYELKLCSKANTQIGTVRRVKIAGETLSKGELEAKAVELQREQSSKEFNGMQLQTQLFREQIAMLRAEADAARERAKIELELQIRRMQAESEERETRERQRFERDMERERTRQQAEAERQERSRQNDIAMAQQHNLALQALQKEQTAILVAAMQAQNNRADPLEAAERINNMVESRVHAGQEDPIVENTKNLWGAVNRGLELAATSMDRDVVRTPGPKAAAGQKAQRNPGPAAKTQVPPNGPPRDAPPGIKEGLTQLFHKIVERGLDPVDVIKKLNEGELVIVDPEAFEDGQEAIAELEAREDADEQHAKGPTENPRSGSSQRTGPDESAVEPSEGSNGQSEATAAPSRPDETVQPATA